MREKLSKILVINPNHKKGENHETIHVHFDAAGNHIFLHRGASPGEKETPTKEKKEMMEMMKDSSMMNMMMDQIASDQHTRMTMMDKMMKHVEGDSASMMSMCKHMMKHKGMMSMMMKMMMDEGMMDHGKMQKNSADTTMTGHEAHHKKN